MYRFKNKKSYLIFILLSVLLCFVILFSFGCYDNREIAKKSAQIENDTQIDSEIMSTEIEDANSSSVDPSINDSNTSNEDDAPPFGSSGFGIEMIDGLHVTGTPPEIDISTYGLKITGLVEKELNLTFDEIKAMPAERIYAELNCPGFFVDKGYWTGVKISYLTDMAGINKNEAKKLVFSDFSGEYNRNVEIAKISQEGFLVAYQFNDKEFPEVHGFPLRIVAKDEPGSLWVKWLGEIKVE
jgi:hypothetical protein